MSLEIKVPSVGESVSEVELGEWLKSEGESVSSDETLVLLESDKATVELPAPASGVVSKILKQQGDVAAVGEVIALLEEGAAATSENGSKVESDAVPSAAPEAEKAASAKPKAAESKAADGAPTPGPTPAPGANGMAVGTEDKKADTKAPQTVEPKSDNRPPFAMPSAAREMAQNGVSASQISASGPGNRITKEDVSRAAKPQAAAKAQPTEAPVAAEGEEVQRMTPLRRKIAERLVEAQQTAALLTTFNEVDMSATMALRKEHQDAFTKKYGIKLGFMSFFVKGVIEGLKEFPAINAEIKGDYVVYKNHYDIGVAIGGGKALVVPVLRNADRMSFAEVEMAIAEYAARVKEGKITPDELIGGTFTITNGGVYGSLLSTPIVNPPQSGILGMHTIQERPVVKNGQIVIAPMMYIALTYDHRIVDGREAVTFLKKVKDSIENPSRMLLEV